MMSALVRGAVSLIAVSGAATSTPDHSVLIAVIGLISAFVVAAATALFGSDRNRFRSRKPTEISDGTGPPVVVPPPATG